MMPRADTVAESTCPFRGDVGPASAGLGIEACHQRWGPIHLGTIGATQLATLARNADLLGLTPQRLAPETRSTAHGQVVDYNILTYSGNDTLTHYRHRPHPTSSAYAAIEFYAQARTFTTSQTGEYNGRPMPDTPARPT